MRHLFKTTVILASLAFMAVVVCAAEDRDDFFDPAAECSALFPDTVPSGDPWPEPGACAGLGRDLSFRPVQRCAYGAGAVVTSGTAKVVLTSSTRTVGTGSKTVTTGTLSDAGAQFTAAQVSRDFVVILREGTLQQEVLPVAGVVSATELNLSGGLAGGESVPYVVVRRCDSQWTVAVPCSGTRHLWQGSSLGEADGRSAAAACKALNDRTLDGRANWRLPTVAELQDLVRDDCAVEGCRMRSGLGGECTDYWASDLQEPEDPGNSARGFVDMKGGGSGWDAADQEHAVRCIADL